MKLRHKLRRWHVWLGWIVALPFLAWTVSGLVMVARPIEVVRGEDLLRPPPPLPSGFVPVSPQVGPRPVSSLMLEARPDGARWVIRYADGEGRLADAATGRLLPALGAADAARSIATRYTGPEAIASVDRVSGEKPPLDYRRKTDAWRVTMSDGTRFYVDSATGEVTARRTRWWRFYDFMWGLHIMDLERREDAHNPLLIGFGLLALATTVMALVMLPLTIRRRRLR